MRKGKLNDREKALFSTIDSRMAPIQADLDALKAKEQDAMVTVLAIRQQIRAKKPELVPLAEMKASIASTESRNRYYPEFLGRFDDQGKKDAFLDYCEAEFE